MWYVCVCVFVCVRMVQTDPLCDILCVSVYVLVCVVFVCVADYDEQGLCQFD